MKTPDSEITALCGKLALTHSLSRDEYAYLIKNHTAEADLFLADEAVKKRKEIYGNSVYIRGLIEISNICRNNCYYCGIRRGNTLCDRYRLTEEEILACADEGYGLGFRTFVLQGGEDPYFTDDVLVSVIKGIKSAHPDCAVTLSLGERSRESCQRLYNAGADRYLLRHETADRAHYEKLHPEEMSFDNRIRCLRELKEIGYQTGCGFMVGSPFQTPATIAEDLKFIEEFSPDMCGIGPFIPHKDTPFAAEKSGNADFTCFLLSVIRLIKPDILLPATTALATLDPMGREKGILSGANVIMPNLSPVSVRKKYELYNNKACTGKESAQSVEELKSAMKAIGFEIVTDRGDIKK